MSTDADGERKMQIGKGASAASAPEDAVKPTNATNTASDATRLLAEAN
jgi:hypothetical protein